MTSIRCDNDNDQGRLAGPAAILAALNIPPAVI
jgi:hypothetical protein